MPVSLLEASRTLRTGNALTWKNSGDQKGGEVQLKTALARRLFEFLLKSDPAKVAEANESLFPGLIAAGQAYRAGEINGDSLQALTMATKSQQKEWLALFEDEEQTAPTGWYLKKWLLGGEQIPTTAALFELAEYKGEIVTDLFGEESYFGDIQAFWTLQNAAIEARKASYLEQGWKYVEALPIDHRFNAWEYEKASKKKGGAVYITVSGRGEVEAHEGYVSRQDARRRDKKEKGGEPEVKPEKPELTKAAQNYLARVIEIDGEAAAV